MKKYILILLFPMSAFAQKDTLTVKAPLIKTQTGTIARNEISIDAALLNTISSHTSDLAANKIKDAAQDAAIAAIPTGGGGTSSPASIEVNTSSYTLNAADNGRVIYVNVTSTIYCPVLVKDFKCKLIRVGGTTTIAPSGTGISSQSNYRRISGVNSEAFIDYQSATNVFLTGKLTR